MTITPGYTQDRTVPDGTVGNRSATRDAVEETVERVAAVGLVVVLGAVALADGTGTNWGQVWKSAQVSPA
jgi:hypothetical protein